MAVESGGVDVGDAARLPRVEPGALAVQVEEPVQRLLPRAHLFGARPRCGVDLHHEERPTALEHPPGAGEELGFVTLDVDLDDVGVLATPIGQELVAGEGGNLDGFDVSSVR